MRWVRSNEPIVWSLFGAGGMVAAFFLPAIIIVIGLLYPLGMLDADALSYARVQNFSASWVGKLCWLTMISLPIWHAMHRIYHGLHDLKVGARGLCFYLCYGLAFATTVATMAILSTV